MGGVTPVWARSARCRGTDTSVMYPPPNEPAALKAAVAVCDGCPVRPDCLRHALTEREDFGVWGGTTPKQRHRLNRLVAIGGWTVDEVVSQTTTLAPTTVKVYGSRAQRNLLASRGST